MNSFFSFKLWDWIPASKSSSNTSSKSTIETLEKGVKYAQG